MKLAPSLLLFAPSAFAATAACGDDVSAPQLPSDPQVRAVVVAGDFDTTGVVSVVDVDDGTIATNVLAGAAGADPVIRRIGDELFVVNRFGPTGSSVTVLDARTLALRHQFSTGPGSNPQDVAILDDKLYLPALGTAGVVVLDRIGARSILDLSNLDPDGKPDCVSAVAVGDTLVIACGLLDGFAATRDAKVVRYRPKAGTIDVSTLAARNPVGFFATTPEDSIFSGDLLIPTASFTAPTSQCVARVDPATGASSCAFPNSALGGVANHIEVHRETSSLLVTGTSYDASNRLQGALRVVDLSTGAVAPTPLSAASQAIADFATCPDGSIVASDATPGAGVRIFRDGAERTDAPLAIGLPPSAQNGIVCY